MNATDTLVSLARRAEVAEADRDALCQALAALVGCIDGSAADDGPPITRGSPMAQVCTVLQRTLQYDRAKRLLATADALPQTVMPTEADYLEAHRRLHAAGLLG